MIKENYLPPVLKYMWVHYILIIKSANHQVWTPGVIPAPAWEPNQSSSSSLYTSDLVSNHIKDTGIPGVANGIKM